MKKTTLITIKQAIRNGYAWPGGYRLNIREEHGDLIALYPYGSCTVLFVSYREASHE